jgi:hypothetical protein
MIYGRILGLEQPVAESLLVDFSPEAAHRLGEIAGTIATTPKGVVHQALRKYEELREAREQGITTIRLTHKDGTSFDVPIEALVGE